jgi:6,7-dimethyl-8-ribityllumazine synthase
MSRSGAPELAAPDGGSLRVGVVAAQWHETVMDGLLAGALRALDECGVQEPTVVRVPGTFELAVVAKHLGQSGYDAVVCLGVVVRGGTPHFDYVCRAATDGINRVALDTGVPVGFGVLTCDSDEQALERAGLPGSKEDKGHEAALAAVSTALTIRSLRRGG